EIVDAYDWSMCQVMYNYYDVNFQAGKEGLEYAAEKGIAVVAMEPLRGGSLVNGLPADARALLKEKAPERSNVEWAFRWVWNQPDVSVVLSGMSTMDQVTENLELTSRVSDAPWTERDRMTIEQVTGVIKELQRVPCTACNYCMPCPEGVNIPRNFSLCNDHHMLADPSAKGRYMGLLSEAEKASNCVRCGQCEPQCPQQISIMD
ncbi:MAG: aldo/keto reductase, partial [Planctomycetes bacterium]|nr:aldo/keto reductase [Planctomycetota bacterium]